MLIVGERINTSRNSINEAVEKGDAVFIANEVQKQAKAGADYIDLNAGSRLASEKEDLLWLIKVAESASEKPLSLDSPDAQVLLQAIKQVQKRPMINSTTAERNRFEAMKPVFLERDCEIIGLCLDERGIPKSAEEAIKNAAFLVENLTRLGISPAHIHLDPLIQPLSVHKDNGLLALETIRRLHAEFPEVKLICGLSNISFGLPSRFLLNRIFIVLCLGAGLDGAIVDPLDQKLMTNILVAETLLGKDDYCLKYLRANRAGTLIG